MLKPTPAARARWFPLNTVLQPSVLQPSVLLRAVLSVALLALVSAAVPTTSAAQDDPQARDIMQKVNDRDEGDNQTTDMEMILIDRRGEQRVRRMSSLRKKKGEDSQSMLFFQSPADVKGTGFLTYDYDASGKDDDQWLYLPALRKTKRIAAGDKSGSFMGSDFNYSDMTSRDLADYDFTLMKEEEVDGNKTWQIQTVPRSPDIAEETGYAKSVVWVRQDNYVVVRAVGFVNKSQRRKYMQIKQLEQIDGVWVALELQMVTKEGKTTVHSTVIRFSNVRFNQNLDDSLFTVRQLEKGL